MVTGMALPLTPAARWETNDRFPAAIPWTPSNPVRLGARLVGD